MRAICLAFSLSLVLRLWVVACFGERLLLRWLTLGGHSLRGSFTFFCAVTRHRNVCSSLPGCKAGKEGHAPPGEVGGVAARVCSELVVTGVPDNGTSAGCDDPVLHTINAVYCGSTLVNNYTTLSVLLTPAAVSPAVVANYRTDPK
jgi:hypothetical protein